MVDLSTELLAEIGGWAALKEARSLVEQGRVSEGRREGDVVRGRVRGAEKIYDAQIVLGARIAAVEVKCTCIESRRWRSRALVRNRGGAAGFVRMRWP